MFETDLEVPDKVMSSGTVRGAPTFIQPGDDEACRRVFIMKNHLEHLELIKLYRRSYINFAPI